MTQENSLAHMTWTCKHHVVWVPKYRKRFFGDLRRDMGQVLRELARQREIEIKASSGNTSRAKKPKISGETQLTLV